MKIIEFSDECREIVAAVRTGGASVGFVPTMGCLHEGHYSLIERAAKECDFVVVSIFVNPTQFGADEDLDAYPRRADEDIAGCRQRGASVVFMPEVAQIYRSWPDTEP